MSGQRAAGSGHEYEHEHEHEDEYEYEHEHDGGATDGLSATHERRLSRIIAGRSVVFCVMNFLAV